jgi:hypothetical protein
VSARTYYVLSRKPEPNEERTYVTFEVHAGQRTLLNDRLVEVKDAEKFLTVGDILERAQVRGRNHPGGTSLEKFQIVKVEETETPGTKTVERCKEGEEWHNWVICVNGGHYLATSGHGYEYALRGAMLFPSEPVAARYVAGRVLPYSGGINHIKFIPVCTVTTAPAVTQKLTVL